jgi:hypothetical protein
MSYARRTQRDTDAHQTAGISIDIMQYAFNTNGQQKNANTFPFYLARPRTARKHKINTKEHGEPVLYPFSGFHGYFVTQNLYTVPVVPAGGLNNSKIPKSGNPSQLINYPS